MTHPETARLLTTPEPSDDATTLQSVPIVNLRYPIRGRNLGSMLGPHLLQAEFGVEAKWSMDPGSVHLIANGSLMSLATRHSFIWGTGLISPLVPCVVDPEKVRAVRGKLTYWALKQKGLALRDVPLGDPGFLAARPEFVMGRQKRFKLGVVAHNLDRCHPWLHDVLQDREVADLNVHDDLVTYLQKLSECEVVASSSLYGLILAEGLKIPNVWLEISPGVSGLRFRFKDWFSLAIEPQTEPLSIASDLTTIASAARLHGVSIATSELKDAFPRQEVLTNDHESSLVRVSRRPKDEWYPSSSFHTIAATFFDK